MDFENDELPPLPRMPSATSPKRVRRRPRFSRDTAVASTVVPSPSPDQVISTLIDSLTAISQDARDQLKREFQSDNLQGLRQESASESQRPPSQDSFYVDIPVHRDHDPLPNDDYEDSDGDVAAAPVIRFTRAPPEPKQKGNKKDTTGLYLNTMGSDPNLSVRNSIQSLRSEGTPGSIGVPSIERANGSSTSLAGSIRSSRSLIQTEHDQFRDQTLQHSVPSRRSSTTTTGKHDRTKARFSFEVEDDIEGTFLRVDTDTAKHLDSSPSDNPETNTSSPLNALLGRGVGEHLIPSRRSSRRRSSQSDNTEGYRHSVGGSTDLRDLNIDEDLLGSDDSTVRRIRELQEARERRQNEWRKESRRSLDRSDRPGKRHSAPSPKATHRTSTYQGSKLSVTEVLVESEQETPDLSARVDASDLADLPALITPSATDSAPLTPIPISPSHRPVLPRSAQSTPTPATNALTSHIQTSPPRSLSIKRSSTISSRKRDSTVQGDVRSVHDEVEKFLAASRLTQKIRHPRTGRTIAFSEVGDPDGFAVFCCVGMGMTRYVMTFYDELARTLKLRLITPDRPGVGESEGVPDRLQNPLTWVDDVAVICSCLEISRFSLLAHSAGSIYALATALKMPQYVRGRIHLLAPWIPPSQMPKGAAIGPDSQPVANLPMAHRILSVLPAPFLKVANSKFLSATSASVETKPLKGKKLRNLESFDNLEKQFIQSYSDLSDSTMSGVIGSTPGKEASLHSSPATRNRGVSCYQANNDTLGLPSPPSTSRATPSPSALEGVNSARMSPEARAALYNSVLTHRIWTLATLNANPAIDLLTCLERRKTIGFRYAEVTRSVVIRHGAKDGRVPLDNVRWLQSIMKRCELRVLEDEGHSLMASAAVMSSVLSEIAREWDEWQRIAKDKEKRKRGENSPGMGKENKAMSLRSLGTISVRS